MKVDLSTDEICDLVAILEIIEEDINPESEWRTRAEFLEAKLLTILENKGDDI